MKHRLTSELDRLRSTRSWVGFCVAVFQRFSQDHASRLAALIAYYAFFALFPMLFVAITILHLVLRSHHALQADLLRSAFAQFPVFGDAIRENVQAASGSAAAIAIGLATAAIAGLGAMTVLQESMDTIWRVPDGRRPRKLVRLLRGSLMLVVLGGFMIVASASSAVWWSTRSGPVLVIAGVVVSTVLNFGIFLVAFKTLTAEDLYWRDVAAGAIAGAIAWSLLQHAGSYFIRQNLRHAGRIYGSFALMIGLLSWMYVGAHVGLLCAEINVVRASRRQHPHRDGAGALTAHPSDHGRDHGLQGDVDQLARAIGLEYHESTTHNRRNDSGS